MAEQSPSQLDKARASLFDDLLRFVAETDWVSGPDAPTIFVVYAHDLDGYASARQEVVRQIIDWLVQIRARVLSDRSPLDGRADTERKEAVGNILANQYCLFPVNMPRGSGKSRGDIVDKVVVCGSQVLEQYCRDPYSKQYMGEIEEAFYAVETGNFPKLQHDEVGWRERRIRNVVEANTTRHGFHHVLTELALVKIRKQGAQDGEHGIVPVSLDGKGMGYLGFIENCSLYLKPRHETISTSHIFFFKLLQHVYPHSKCQTLAIKMRAIYEAAVRRFKEAGVTETGTYAGIIADEVGKLGRSLADHESADVRFSREKHRGTKSEAQASNREGILRWLPSPDGMYAIQAANIDQRTEQTGTWLLRKSAYKKLKETELTADRRSRLWCHGSPGSGKTILASVMIQDLQENPSDAVAFFFCQYTDKSTVTDMVLNLVSQLAHRQISPALQSTYMNKVRAGSATATWSLKEAVRILAEEIELFERVFLVVDGVDERLGDNVAQRLISSLRDTQANIVITSCDHWTIRSSLEPGLEILISTRQSDITAYLRYRLDHDVRRSFTHLVGAYQDLEDDMIRVISDRSGSIFLLARIHVDLCIINIRRYPTVKTFQDVLQELEKLPKELKAAYQLFIARIKESNEWELARDVLVWVIFAKEPVTINVVQEAISLQRKGDILDEKVDAKTLLSYCLGLVRLAPVTQLVEFIHPSAAQYFESTEGLEASEWLQESRNSVTISSLKCLNLKNLRTSKSSLWGYAVQFWGRHSQDDYDTPSVPSLLSTYLSHTEKTTNALRETVPRDFVDRCQHPLPKHCVGAHAAAFHGVSRYLESTGDVDITDSNGWTPLWWALLGQQDNAMETLLKKGASVSTRSTLGVPMWIWMFGIPQATALTIVGKTFSADHQSMPEMHMISKTTHHVLSTEMHGEDMPHIGPKYFIPRKLDFKPRQVNNEFWRIATILGIHTIANRLDRSSLNSSDQDGNTILMIATNRGHRELAHSLLDQGADISPRNNMGETAFSLSLPVNDWNVFVKDCVFKDGAFSLGAEFHQHALTFLDPHSFIHRIQQDEVLSLRLLPQDIEPNRDIWRASLANAIILRYHRVVHALLDRGVGVNTSYQSGHTPLLLACSDPCPQLYVFHGNETHGEALVVMGHMMTVCDDEENSSIEQASLLANPGSFASETAPAFEATVRLLLSKGANMEEDFYGLTPLALAGKTRQLSVFRELLRAGADISRVPPRITQGVMDYLRKQPDSRGTPEALEAPIDTFPTQAMRDFQTHDYCELLIQSSNSRPLATCYFIYNSPHGDSDFIQGSLGSLEGCQFALASSIPVSVESSARTDTKSDAEELLYMIEHAQADISGFHQRRQLCLRHVFWSFGRSTWFIIRNCHRDEWYQYMRWRRVIDFCLLGITPWENPRLPDIRLHPPQMVLSRTQSQLRFLGCIKHEEVLLHCHRPPHNTPITHNFLVECLVYWVNLETVWRARCAFNPFGGEAWEIARALGGFDYLERDA